MKIIQTASQMLSIQQEDGMTHSYTRQPDESLAQWYWRSFQLIAESLGFDECITRTPATSTQLDEEPKNTPEKPVSTYVQKEPFPTTYKESFGQSLADRPIATPEQMSEACAIVAWIGIPLARVLADMGLQAP